MSNVVGLYKHLAEGEHIVQESADLCEVYSKSGLGFWGWITNTPPDTSVSKVYLTNKRLLLLSIYSGKLEEMKSGKSNITGISCNWIEIPLRTVTEVETPAKMNFGLALKSLFGKVETKGELIVKFLGVKKQQEKKWFGLTDKHKPHEVSFIIENRDAWATSIENVIDLNVE